MRAAGLPAGQTYAHWASSSLIHQRLPQARLVFQFAARVLQARVLQGSYKQGSYKHRCPAVSNSSSQSSQPAAASLQSSQPAAASLQNQRSTKPLRRGLPSCVVVIIATNQQDTRRRHIHTFTIHKHKRLYLWCTNKTSYSIVGIQR